MATYAKDDCRNNGGPIKVKASKYPKLVKGTTWFTGENRHERRAKKSGEKFRLNAKGKSGIGLLRKMFKGGGINETILLMNGANRGKRFHPGYPKVGDYTLEGFKLASKKGGK